MYTLSIFKVTTFSLYCLLVIKNEGIPEQSSIKDLLKLEPINHIFFQNYNLTILQNLYYSLHKTPPVYLFAELRITALNPAIFISLLVILSVILVSVSVKMSM